MWRTDHPFMKARTIYQCTVVAPVALLTTEEIPPPPASIKVASSYEELKNISCQQP